MSVTTDKRVPREPTEAMMQAVYEWWQNTDKSKISASEGFRQRWRAMYDAAPSAPEQGQAQEPCTCEACKPQTPFEPRFIVCAICGNKRCPHATDHRNVCTGSNDAGQVGSSYAAPVSTAPFAVDGLIERLRVIAETDRMASRGTLREAAAALTALQAELDQAIDAVRRLTAGEKFEAVVAAHTIANHDSHWQQRAEAAEREVERLRAAIQLVWSIYVRKECHLGLERASGLEQHCIACICALAIGRSIDGDGGLTAADFNAETAKIKSGDAALAQQRGGA